MVKFEGTDPSMTRSQYRLPFSHKKSLLISNFSKDSGFHVFHLTNFIYSPLKIRKILQLLYNLHSYLGSPTYVFYVESGKQRLHYVGARGIETYFILVRGLHMQDNFISVLLR